MRVGATGEIPWLNHIVETRSLWVLGACNDIYLIEALVSGTNIAELCDIFQSFTCAYMYIKQMSIVKEQQVESIIKAMYRGIRGRRI